MECAKALNYCTKRISSSNWFRRISIKPVGASTEYPWGLDTQSLFTKCAMKVATGKTP